jgi:hypothetical protein
MKNSVYGVLMGFLLLQSCYSFKSTAIDYDVLKTFSVVPFENKSSSAPVGINREFTDKVRDKFRNSTRLSNEPSNGDIVITGYIKEYRTTAAAAQPGITTALQQLDVVVYVKYQNNKQEGKNWDQDFKYQLTFGTEQNFVDIQDALNQEAFDNILDQIFNKAFSGW